jgi:poly(A) polymerase
MSVYEAGFSALDAYFGVRKSPLRFALAEGGLVDLAKSSETLSYPGLFYADAAIEGDSSDGEGLTADKATVYIRLADSLAEAEPAAFAPLDFFRDPAGRGVFHDPRAVYHSLRLRRLEARTAPPEEVIFEAAALVSRYDYEAPSGCISFLPRDFPLGAQRDLLCLILTGAHPEKGLNLLKDSGFIAAYWPEIEELAGVSQAKEFHPEGDVWAHTMETFRYRKLPDLRLSLGLLLHDSGKPRANAVGANKFDRHAEIGEAVARRFLSRLGFPSSLGQDVSYLVRYHMLPAALPRLPLERGIDGVDEPLFPLLLELYKCDELSTFKGPEGYYEACAAYRSHLKQGRNPYRNPEAQRLARLYLNGN